MSEEIFNEIELAKIKEQQDRDEEIVQYYAEQEIMKEMAEEEDHNPQHCFCTKHW